MNRLDKYTQVEKVLGECFNIDLLDRMKVDWRGFYTEPSKFEDTIVVDMVKSWIEEQYEEGLPRPFLSGKDNRYE